MKRALRSDIEGLDGVGKSTAWNYIINSLRDKGYRVLDTREVGNPHVASCKKLREFVLDPLNSLDGLSMEFIFAAMRIENHKFYKQVEKDYDFIISDRGWFSHLAYTDHNASREFTEDFYMEVVRNLTTLPDAVVYLEADPEIALSRRQKRGTTDVIEAKGQAFQIKVGESFDRYLKMHKQTTPDMQIFRVSSNEGLEVVNSRLDKVITQLIELASR